MKLPTTAILITLVGAALSAQVPQSQQALPLDQLTNLVAPVALYPDELLAQVLAASTYPLEIVEAQQWLRQNGNLMPDQLMQAARQQNWDPSVQALVAFPDAVALLSRDIRWTTDLGNAFLSQQKDVMGAIQTLRARARSNGQLVSGPQQVLATQSQNGQSAIAIHPADPQVVYVPIYNPQAVWGAPPPMYQTSYAPMYQTPYAPNGYGAGPAVAFSNFASAIGGPAIRFGAGVLLRTLFNGVMHFSAWGWAFNWLANALFMNPLFFHNNGYQGYGGGFGADYAGGYHTVAWVHNPVHRMGVAYPTPLLASRFASGRNSYAYRSQTFRAAANYHAASEYRPAASSYRNPAPHQYAQSFAQPNRNMESRYSAPRTPASSNFNRASSSSFASAQHYSAPKARHYSAPKAPHYSAPHSSGHSSGHRGGGHSGKHH